MMASAFNANNFGVIKNKSSQDKDAKADTVEATLKHLNTRIPKPGGSIVSAADLNYHSSGMGLLGPHQHEHTIVNKKLLPQVKMVRKKNSQYFSKEIMYSERQLAKVLHKVI